MKAFRKLVLFITVIAILIPALPVSGQSSEQEIRSDQLSAHFGRLYQPDSRLISGSYYQDLTPPSTSGHPFWDEADWCQGTINLNDRIYDSLQLRYDISRNELVCNLFEYAGTPIHVSLNKTHIRSFSLDGKKFIPFPGTDTAASLRYGELLTDGPVRLVTTRSKKLSIPIGGSTSYAYDMLEKMYILFDQNIVRYKGAHTLLKTFPQNRSRLKGFIKANHLRTGNRFKEHQVLLVNYCNNLLTTSR